MLRAVITAAMLVGLSACSSTSNDATPADKARAAYDKLIEEFKRECPGGSYGPTCRPHTEEPLNRGHQLREAIKATAQPDRYTEAVEQLDWMEHWASKGTDDGGNQVGVRLSVEILRDWADQGWPNSVPKSEPQ